MKMKEQCKPAGFTLLELLVVMAIIAILATVSAGAFTSREGLLRGQLFSMMADFNMARSEAVRQGRDILISLHSGGEVDDDGLIFPGDGYRICYDRDDDGNCDKADQMIRDVTFRKEVKLYDIDLSAPAGPAVTINGDPWVSGRDGVTFSGNRFLMRSSGVSNKAGSVYLFTEKGNEMISGPFALVLNRIGRMRILRWRPGKNLWHHK